MMEPDLHEQVMGWRRLNIMFAGFSTEEAFYL